MDSLGDEKKRLEEMEEVLKEPDEPEDDHERLAGLYADAEKNLARHDKKQDSIYAQLLKSQENREDPSVQWGLISKFLQSQEKRAFFLGEVREVSVKKSLAQARNDKKILRLLRITYNIRCKRMILEAGILLCLGVLVVIEIVSMFS